MCKHSVGVRRRSAVLKLCPRSRYFFSNTLPAFSFCVVVNNSASVHAERRRAISECTGDTLERRRRPGG